MPATHHRDLLQKPLSWIFIMICKQKRTHLNPRLTPALQPAQTPKKGEEEERKKESHKNLGHVLDSSKRRKRMLQNSPGQHFEPRQGMHTTPHKEGSQQFQEALRSRIKIGNNAETPGKMRNMQNPAASLAGWPNHHK